jgi:hypothetical protein
MSRSYKKNWVLKDSGHKGRRFAKRQAAKAVRRRQFEVQDGKHYRKFFNSYDIYDWMMGAWTAADRREGWVNRKVWGK